MSIDAGEAPAWRLVNLRPWARQLTGDEFLHLRALAFATGAVLERDGLSVLGLGRAHTIELPEGLTDDEVLAAVATTLARLGGDGSNRSGPKPLAIGAFGFLPGAPAVLVVPRLAVVARPGQGAVALAIAGEPGSAVAGNDLARGTGESAGADPADVLEEYLAAPIPEKMAPPDSFKLESCRPHDEFLEQVAAAVTEVRSGRLSKVVLAREVRVEANRPLRQEDLLERLRSLHPSCTAFAVEGFIGASPELLIKLDGRAVESHPLAGTAARSGDPVADAAAETALLTSPKERAEHRAVVDSIAGRLAPAVAELEVPEGPAIVELRNVSHLGTHIKGRLAVNGSRPPNSLQLLALIHPTPAVSGTPIGAAIEYLATAEGLDRDKYAGAVGWIDAAGDGEWHLGIRCAIVDGRTARLFAGVGIVADSDPAAELRETQLKLQAFLAAAVRP